MAGTDLPGLWLLITRVEPELPPVNGCHIDPKAFVEAVALGLVPSAAGCPLQLELTYGLPARDAVEPFDLGTLAALLRRLEEGHEASAALGAAGRLTLRPSRKTLAGPHDVERFPSRSALPVETERRMPS
jgi:hypothetical protein